tara:strand:+ start:191 stop:580 length:390 start_codon:yes stop_codon:yes gene_type:complete
MAEIEQINIGELAADVLAKRRESNKTRQLRFKAAHPDYYSNLYYRDQAKRLEKAKEYREKVKASNGNVVQKKKEKRQEDDLALIDADLAAKLNSKSLEKKIVAVLRNKELCNILKEYFFELANPTDSTE